MQQIIADRFKEASTWRGVVMLMTALGVSISPETMDYVVAAGTGLSGLIGLVTRDGAQ